MSSRNAPAFGPADVLPGAMNYFASQRNNNNTPVVFSGDVAPSVSFITGGAAANSNQPNAVLALEQSSGAPFLATGDAAASTAQQAAANGGRGFFVGQNADGSVNVVGINQPEGSTAQFPGQVADAVNAGALPGGTYNYQNAGNASNEPPKLKGLFDLLAEPRYSQPGSLAKALMSGTLPPATSTKSRDRGP